MVRFQPSSILISEKDLQCHLERISIRRQNQAAQLQQYSVERSVIHENQAVTVSSSLPSFGSSSPVQESGLNIALETKLNYSLLWKDDQDFRSPCSISSSDISIQSQVSRRRGSVQPQHVSNIQDNQVVPQDHHIHHDTGNISLEEIIGHPFLRQHDSSSCGINAVGESISSQYLFRDMVDSFASLALQRQSNTSSDLIHKNQERMFRTQQSFTEPDIHHIEAFLPKSVSREKIAFSPCPPSQFPSSIPLDPKAMVRLFELPGDNLQFNNSPINTRPEATPYLAFISDSYSGQRRDCEFISQANTMEENSKKRKEHPGYRRAQTLPSNTNEAVCAAVSSNASAATAQHPNVAREDEQRGQSGQILEQPQVVGEEIQRRMKDHRRMIRWKPWFEAQQLFLNTSGKNFSAARPGQRPILVSEPTWLQQQASSMSEEAIQSAQQVPFKGYQPAFMEGDDNIENARPAAKEQAVEEHDNVNPPPLASSKQTLAEHIAYRNKNPPKRRNSEPAVLDKFHQIAFKNSLEFADHILDATYYVNDPNWDTIFDFGYLAVQDRPVEEWRRL